ncbi:MAG: hypothetical protein QOI21_1745 [Actinomycetota bacterium]|jgi:hypothetical protein|nr:hypothetical protein [Actinomycetota bacterium]
MANPKHADLSALTGAAVDGVITTARLRAAGLSPGSIAARCRPDGPWQRLMPGVVLLGTSAPTRRQRLRAVVDWLGPESVITGLDALRAHGAELPIPPSVHLLVGANRRVMPAEFMVLQRTTRLPVPVHRNGLPYAPPARAVVDTARRENDPERLHQLLGVPLYWGLCTTAQLRAELDAGNQRGTSAVRNVLRHLGHGTDTFTFGMARRLLRQAPLPPPSWGVTVCDLRGRPIGLADAWWDEIGMAWQFGAEGEGRAKPRMNHLALTAAGVAVVRCTTAQLRTEPGLVARELVTAFSDAARRRRPKVQALGMEAFEVAA